MKQIWNALMRLLGYSLAAVLLILFVMAAIWLIVLLGKCAIEIWNSIVRMVMLR